ncbi:MAG: hypothetical protein JO348_12775 [Alphaproteobacteria bacterium]|nr:hypothetical protein [Alphaproteobacteria bacterium]
MTADTEFSGGERRKVHSIAEGRKEKERNMTNPNTYAPSERNAFSGAVVSALTTALVVLAGFLTFAQFANI